MTTSKPLGSASRPTLADLDALPPGIIGEIIEGVLYTMNELGLEISLKRLTATDSNAACSA